MRAKNSRARGCWWPGDRCNQSPINSVLGLVYWNLFQWACGMERRRLMSVRDRTDRHIYAHREMNINGTMEEARAYSLWRVSSRSTYTHSARQTLLIVTQLCWIMNYSQPQSGSWTNSCMCSPKLFLCLIWKGPCLFFLRECISSALEICVQSGRRRRVCRNVWIIQQPVSHFLDNTLANSFEGVWDNVSQIYSQNHFFRDCEFIRP